MSEQLKKFNVSISSTSPRKEILRRIEIVLARQRDVGAL